MKLLIDEFYLDEIYDLYQNYLEKFKKDICFSVSECCEDSIITDKNILAFPFEDELLLNKLDSPKDYLHDLIFKKVGFNFKNLSNYRVDRSYLNRILNGKMPSKNTLISIGYFLNLDLNEMSELLNVYGFAFGNSMDDRIVFCAFKNSFGYDEFLELVENYSDNGLKKFFITQE